MDDQKFSFIENVFSALFGLPYQMEVPSDKKFYRNLIDYSALYAQELQSINEIKKRGDHVYKKH